MVCWGGCRGYLGDGCALWSFCKSAVAFFGANTALAANQDQATLDDSFGAAIGNDDWSVAR